MNKIVDFTYAAPELKDVKIFFGETDGIQRYDRAKYPITDRLVKVQQGSIWFPKEISYAKDMIGITTLSPEHLKVYTLNLMFQTVADSYANRHLDNVLCNYITSPEWERVLKWQALFELIHSEAYSENIRKVFADAEKVFNEGMTNINIQQRLKVELDCYEQFKVDILSDNKSIQAKALVRECLLQYALENIRFMISFLYTYRINEANNQVLQGSVNNITLILNDETIHTAIFKHLLNILKSTEDEGVSILWKSGWAQAELLKIFDAVIESELEWFDYLSSIAEFEGFNRQQAKEFLCFYANRALEVVGQDDIYTEFAIRNELVEFFENKRRINNLKSLAQETDILSYNIGTLEDGDFYETDLLEFYKKG